MTDPDQTAAPRLPLLTRLIYGSGDWGMASYNTLRLIFYAIFLTDTVGLEPRLASFAALFGLIWDAINDPLVGMFSDRVRTRFGRRRPFLLLFAIPFGFGFLLLWWTPPWQSQIAVAVHVTLAYIIADTLQTLVAVPHNSLTPELTPDYDERTSLAGFRMLFNLIASLVTAVAAPMIVDGVMVAGGTSQQGYLTVAALFGALAAIPYLLIGLVVREPAGKPVARTYTFRQTVETAWRNVPFRFATLLYMLNWLTFDLVSLMLPYFLVYWVAGGNLLAQANLFGIKSGARVCGVGADADHGVGFAAFVDLARAAFRKAGGLYRWDGVLGCGAARHYLYPAGAGDICSGPGGVGGNRRVYGACVAGRHFPGRDRMGRAAHGGAARGNVLRRQELHPQADQRAGDLPGVAGSWLVRLSDPA